MKAIFSKISLKSVLYVFTGSTVCLLMLIIFLAGKQYLLFRHCEQLVNSSQTLLFQFTGMKEHINETLLSRTPLNSAELIKEVQGLDKEINTILDDILIPEEFKLTFISQVDLVNVTVSLRNFQNSTDTADAGELAALSKQLRIIHTKLTGFHQLITRYTQTQLLGLHRALVGMLALVVAIVSIMLLVVNRYITSPIIHYCRTLFPKKSSGDISLFTLHKTIETLAENPSPEKTPGTGKTIPVWPAKELSRLYRYSSIGHLFGGLGHELTNRANGIINYTQAIQDLSEDLQLDNDSKNLLQKLFSEEKKMSLLLSNMITFTSGSKSGEAKILTLEELFGHISVLTRGTLKTDGITMSVTLEDSDISLNYHVSDLQLVILSALQSGRTAVNKHFKNDMTGLKKIDVVIDEENITDSHITISIYDNGSPWKLEQTHHGEGPHRPWHNMNFCKQFVETFGGSLNVVRNENQLNHCTITIPRNKQTTS